MNAVYTKVYCKFHENCLRVSKSDMKIKSEDNKHDDIINLFFVCKKFHYICRKEVRY